MSLYRVLYHRWRKIWSLIRSSDFATAVFVIILVLTTGSIGISLFEIGRSGEFSSLGSSLWWSIVTATTVGYGDKVPVTTGGKIFGSFLMLMGIASISLFTASVSSMLVARKIREGKGLEEIKTKNHFVICGWNYHGEAVLNSFMNFTAQIKDREIVMVNDLQEETANDLLYKYKQISPKFVKGDFTSESVLVRAGIKSADAAVILPDLSNPTRLRADEKTILATLTIKSIAPKIRVYAHVLERESETHLKRANITDVTVSDEFSGFLLVAHVLFPGLPQIVNEILSYEGTHVLRRLEIPAEFKGKPFKQLSEYFKHKNNQTVIALINEKESVKISDILVGDYSFLDEFIERKFREAGRGILGEEQVSLRINPDNEYIVKDEKYVAALCSI